MKTWDELWKAVRREAIAHAERGMAGLNPKIERGDSLFSAARKWTSQKQAMLEAMLDLSQVNAARDAAEQLRLGLEAVVTFADAANAAEEAERKGKPFEPVQGHFPIPLVRELAESCRPLLDRLPRKLVQLTLQRRALLIAEFDRPAQWWWHDRPSTRDLAVLSLLAGNRPQLKDKPSAYDVESVIVAEQNALNHWRRRFHQGRPSLQRRKRPAVKT
ncbi:MAG TPA: hypothetical protein VJN18_14390 [Polyangiaceae bacterium]|nr:hypothetical protein [Polyangiaceae bacterium]